MKKFISICLLVLSSAVFASPYRGDWDLKATGLKISDGENGELHVTWCKRIPFVREGRCTSTEVMVFTIDSEGAYTGKDDWGTFSLLMHHENNDIMHYRATPRWGGDIYLDGVRIKR